MMMPPPGFGGQPMQPRQPMTQPPAGGFGGQPPAMGTPFNKPTGPQVQQPGMGQSALGGQQSSPYDMMQRYQQMMQGLQGFGGQQGGYGMPQQRGFGGFGGFGGGYGMPQQGGFGGGYGMPPQPMGGGRQYGQSSYADPRPDTRPDPFKPLIQRGPDTAMGEPMGIGTPPISQPMDRQRQPGQGYSPEMQAYYDKDRADQIELSRRMLAMKGAGGDTGMPPIGEPMDRQKQPLTQPYTPDPSQVLIRPSAGGMPQQAPMQQQVMRPPAMPQAPNSQQVAFESPRMQAMRNMQRRGGPKR